MQTPKNQPKRLLSTSSILPVGSPPGLTSSPSRTVKDSPVNKILLITPQRKKVMEDQVRSMTAEKREQLVQTIFHKSGKLHTDYMQNVFDQFISSQQTLSNE